MKTTHKIYGIFCFLLFLLFFQSIVYQTAPYLSESTVKHSPADNEPVPATAPVKRIALTFDDGPHPVYTLKLLDGLKERNVAVTFFVIGENAERYPEILKRMHDEGHLIGNHTYSHVQLSCIPASKAMEEIFKTSEIIKKATGTGVKYIRPPYGSLPDQLSSETELLPILWTIDPRDWSVLNTNAVVKHILARAKDGDIILLHDIFETSIDAALIVIDRLKEEGYAFVTVEELLSN